MNLLKKLSKIKERLPNMPESIKSLPKTAWIAAIVLPGGLVVAGAYVAAKTAYDRYKTREKI